jgi:hypothetical protein
VRHLKAAALAALAFSAAGTGALAAEPGMKAWTGFLEGLAGSGFTVTQGSVLEVDNAVCAEFIPVFDSCFGNNAAAPYLIPQVPVGSTYVDPWYATQFTTPGVGGAPSNMFFRLGEADALVTIVSPPPKAAYFGYQSYAFSRVSSAYPGSQEPHTISPDPDRYELFASLGNDVNDVIVDDKAGEFWDGAPVVYITTANRTLGRNLVQRARRRGLPSERMFVEPVGANADIGTGEAADDFVTLIRYALPKDARVGKAWLKGSAGNVLVFRVSAPGGFDGKRFPTPRYTLKQTADETRLEPALDELTTLLAGWLSARGSPVTTVEMSSSDFTTPRGRPFGLVGRDCIAKGTSCLGDNQDTDAYRFGLVGTMSRNDVAIVAGVNHAVVNTASYISLAVYNLGTLTGVASVSQTDPRAVGFDSGTLTGSAEAVLRDLGVYGAASARLKRQLPKLYVQLFARVCDVAEAYCVKITRKAVPPDVEIGLTQRAYVKPGTTTGAAPDLMVTPRVIFTTPD